MYSLNPITGVVKTNKYFNKYSNNIILNFNNLDEIKKYYIDELYKSKPNIFVSDDFLNILENIILKEWQCGQKDYLNLLSHPLGLKFLIQHYNNKNDLLFISHMLNYHSFVYNIKTIDAYKKFIEPYNGDSYVFHFLKEHWSEDYIYDNYFLEKKSAKIWKYRDSPYRWFAKFFLLNDYFEPISYRSNLVNSCIVLDSMSEARKIDINPDLFSDDVVCLDVESDTSLGYGLKPLKTRITDIVLATKNNSWVISGNEDYIFENFIKILNNLDVSYIYGWNNSNYDNILLQSRIEFNEVKNWNWFLSEAVNFTNYDPVGPLFNSYDLVNIDNNIISRDVYQILNEKEQWFENNYFYKGLKSFTKDLGCVPYELDRNYLHMDSLENRQKYVLSDGLLTLLSVSYI